MRVPVSTRRKFITIGLLSSFLIIVSILTSLFFITKINNKTADALSISDWNPGRIIDDYIFTNTSTLDATQIQNFLNSKVPICDTGGTLPASEFGRPDLTHAQYAASRGWQAPPYICLKDFVEGGKSGAQIIYDASQEFQINPQVLIVLLEKEQSLVQDTWPLNSQYRSATGYACGDTSACESQYYGFTNQVRWAARMFRSILNASPTWYSPYVLGNNTIYYNPGPCTSTDAQGICIQRNPAACGSSVVNIQNRSTQALYSYTPYQPNAATLNWKLGSGPSVSSAYPECGAFGNINFFTIFHSWFGSTYNTPGACDTSIPNVMCVWELIKPNGDYFYTTSIAERDASLRNGMSYSQIAFYARPHNGGVYTAGTPTYRLQKSGAHYWTSNEQLRQQYLASGWSSEGVAWYTDPGYANTGSPIYKLRGPNNKSLFVGYAEYSRYIERGYVNENETLNAPTKAVETSPAAGTQLNVYRIATCNKGYIFTTSILEVEAFMSANCGSYEGVAYYAPLNNTNGTVPVIRLYNNARYIWTTSQVEAAVLTAGGWSNEGIAYYIANDSGTPVIRLSNNGRYIWTTSQVEAISLSRVGWIYEGVAFYAPGNAINSAPVSRFNNNGRYIWTTSQVEAVGLAAGGWKYEGVAYYASSSSAGGAIPANRFTNNGRYIWTTSQAETVALTNAGWRYEGIAYYAPSDANGAVPVNRYYNNGRYIWTTSQVEAVGLAAGGWKYEGVAYYAKQ